MDRIKFIPKKRIENIVQNDLQRYSWLTKKKNLSFPLDPRDIFEVLYGLETIYIDFDSIGLRESAKEGILGAISVRYKKILVHTGQIYPGGPLVSKEIQRFSVGHEGAHYVLHHFTPEAAAGSQTELFSPHIFLRKKMSNFICSSKTKYNPIEFQANYYAACLLVPKDKLFELIPCKSIDLQKWSDSLCKNFGVSRQCLEYRLNTLGIKCKNRRYPEEYRQLDLFYNANR